VEKSQDSIDNRLLGLPDLYHRYAIDTFNTYSLGSTHRSLTDTDEDYNHLRVLSGLRLSKLNIASSEKVIEVPITDPWSFDH
jgi:hypothetical protein